MNMSNANIETEQLDRIFPGSSPAELADTVLLGHLINSLAEVSVILMDPDGRVLRCTEITAKRLGFQTPEAIIGKLLTEIAPEDWAHERVLLFRKTIELGRPTTMLSILRGRRMRSTVSPITLTNGDPVVLAVIEQISPERFAEIRNRKNDGTVVIGEVNDLGALDVLSPRELEVLALMGQGHRPKEIAMMLHRSLSTIDGHRERIGEKLGIRDRGGLMAIARAAALQVDDARRTRIKIGHADHRAPSST